MTARETALRILCRLEGEEALFADHALAEAFCRGTLDSRDRALVMELVNGALRWRRRLDWNLDHLLIRKKTADLTVWIRNILRMGLYQLDFLNRIPDSAAVNESVSLAKRYGHRGTASLVNAVLRSALRDGRPELSFPPLEEDAAAHIGLRYSHPDWMVRRWIQRYGPQETVALCRANNRVPPLTVRVNGLRASPSQVRESLAAEGIAAEGGTLSSRYLRLKGCGDPAATEAFRKGWFQVQDESASLAVTLLSAGPGQRTVDVCAAPGGKSSHIAELMGDRGLLLAVDVHPIRLRQVVENCHRLGITCIRPVVADGRCLGIRQADRVMLDAPCSGLGVLARRADLRWKKAEADIERLARLQGELLVAAADLLKKGGLLVYSTCTIEDRENEEVVSRLLSEREDITLEKAVPPVPQDCITPQGTVRTFPHRQGTDGIFAARLRKIGDGENQ